MFRCCQGSPAKAGLGLGTIPAGNYFIHLCHNVVGCTRLERLVHVTDGQIGPFAVVGRVVLLGFQVQAAERWPEGFFAESVIQVQEKPSTQVVVTLFATEDFRLVQGFDIGARSLQVRLKQRTVPLPFGDETNQLASPFVNPVCGGVGPVIVGYLVSDDVTRSPRVPLVID